MIHSNRYIFLLAFVLIGLQKLHAGGWEWKWGAEGGYFDARGDYNTERIRYMTALSGSAKYQRSDGSNTYLLNLRLRPEWYGPQSGNYSLNASGAFQYRRTWRTLELSTGVQMRKQDYRLRSGSLDLYSGQIFGLVSWPFLPAVSAEMEVRYGKAEAAGDFESAIKTLTVLPGVKYYFSRYGSLSGIALIESFKTSTEDPFSTSQTAQGWRMGPQMIFEYSRHWLINLQYLAANRFYENSGKNHIEQEINFVAGKNLTPHWSVFILADYYIRKADSTSGDPVNAQTNYENRIHAKLAYAWRVDRSVYLKLAYSRNELPYQKVTLSGTQLCVGVEIRN